MDYLRASCICLLALQMPGDKPLLQTMGSEGRFILPDVYFSVELGNY